MATTTTKSRSSRSKKNRDVDYDQLCVAVNASYRGLKPFRENRKMAIDEYAGNHFGNRAAAERVPLNLLSIYVQVMTRLLVAKMPRAMISTFDKKMKADVATAQDWTNEELVEMGFDETLERWVVDSFFCVGVLKVALSTPGDAVTANWDMESGEPFAEVVDFDDFVFDIDARRFGHATFMGHRVRIPQDVLADDEQIDAKIRKRYLSGDCTTTDPTSSGDPDERVDNLQKGDEASHNKDTQFLKFVDCWEIYIPSRRIVCLFLASELEAIQSTPEPGTASCKPLKVTPWIGPPCGPYHILSQGTIPNNAMPKSPIQDLYDLHVGFNAMFRKTMRQAEASKLIYAIRGTADKDGNRVVQANDREMIRVDDPSSIVPIQFPGADAALVQFAMMMKDLFDFMAGNLTSMTGRAPAAPTATQEKILAAGQSAQVDDMAQRVLRGTAQVVRSLFWFWWHDPFKTMKSELSVPGLPEISTVRQVKPENREQGSYANIKVKIDIYSMQPQTPASRMQAIVSAIRDLYGPIAAQADKQGVLMDVQTIFSLAAKYMDNPDMADIFSYQAPPESAGEMGSSEEGSTKPPATERTYNRVSSSEKTAQGEANNRVTAMGQAQNNGKPNAGAAY